MGADTVVDSRISRVAGWLFWFGLAVGMSAAALLDRKERSVTPSYRNAAIHWFAGEPLYNMAGTDFIYLPQAALAFAPWGLLPKPAGEVLWRWTIIGLMALGVRRLTRLAGGDDRWFLINSVTSVAMAAGCARNGQSTLMISALMILAMAEAARRHWWRSAILLALAFAFKPLALVLALLMAALRLPMLWRSGVCMLVVALAPFLTQDAGYVLEQLRACRENSRIAFELGETGHWAQLFGMLRVFGLDVPAMARQACRLVAAGGTLLACLVAVRRLSPARSAFYVYSLAACYLMLFNSRTEGSTYAMVGPVYGILLAENWLRRPNWPGVIGYLLAIIATVFSFDLALLVVKRPHEVWLSPLVCILVSLDLLRRLRNETRAPDATGTPSQQPVTA